MGSCCERHWNVWFELVHPFSDQSHRDRLINFNFDTKYVKIEIWNTCGCFLGENSEAFNLSWPKGFSTKNQNVWRIFSFHTKSTVQIPKTFRCVHFQLVKVFLYKNLKILGCANRNEWFSPDLCWFRSNLAQTRWPTACVRRSCEHARNVRTKNFEKADRAKIVRNRAKRAKIRAKKNLEKAGRAKIVRNLAKIRAKKKPWKSMSCENRAKTRETCENPCEKNIVRTFHPNSALRRNFTNKIPNFVPKSAHSNFWPKIAWVCTKNLNILVSDRKPPEFALKSVYWIFWPILARFFQKPAHFKFLVENRLSFHRKIVFFWPWRKLAQLYPATCAS